MEREQIDVGALIVGGGPAGLACAIRLAMLIKNAGPDAPIDVDDIFLLEKAEKLGMHSLSGAVVDTGSLESLFATNAIIDQIPSAVPVVGEHLNYLTSSGSWRIPWVPDELDNKNNAVISLGQLICWMGAKAEELGVNIFTGFSAAQPLLEGSYLRGVITGEKGLDKARNPKQNYDAGYQINSPVTVLAEGSHGSVAKTVISKLELNEGSNQQSYAIGVKELWDIPGSRIKPGEVFHFIGYPFSGNAYGGGWIYGLRNDQVSLGVICGLQYIDPQFDPHETLLAFKDHPKIAHMLHGGKRVRYGAKTIPVGGLWAMPKLHFDGGLLVGDSGGFFNPQRIKGVHGAIQSGSMAADAIFTALQSKDGSGKTLAQYTDNLRNSRLYSELWRARNHHQAFERGMLRGIPHYLLQKVSKGRGLYKRYSSVAGHVSYTKPSDIKINRDNDNLVNAKLDSLYYSGVRHEEDQPAHLKIGSIDICLNRCTEEFGNPCTKFCPASVYELVEDRKHAELKINSANCLHCMTCDIMDPYQNIEWHVPESGGGPRYESM